MMNLLCFKSLFLYSYASFSLALVKIFLNFSFRSFIDGLGLDLGGFILFEIHLI